jgi:hypothetical protein
LNKLEHIGLLSRIKTHARRFGIDDAVLFVLTAKIWQIISGPVTLILIANYFSPQVQGFYYTFASIIALQTFVELGLSIVILNVASHEWIKLSMGSYGSISGDAGSLSRLASLGRFVALWYGAAALIFIVCVGFAGYAFMEYSGSGGVNWEWPWIMLVCISGLQLLISPYNSLLEGCGQISVISKARLIQGIGSSLACWTVFIAGGELWVPVTSALIILVLNVALFLYRYPLFFRQLFSNLSGDTIDWRIEIFPMQWRLAAQGMVNYFLFAVFTPVIFHYHGAEAAGRMGMTMQILAIIQSVSMAWVQTKAPEYATLIAKHDFLTLDRNWLRNSLVSIVVMVFGVSIFLFFLAVLQTHSQNLTERLLPLKIVGILAIGFILMQIIQCFATYLRAHKREVLTMVGLTGGILCGILVWSLGRRFGSEGVAVAFLLVVSCLNLPWVAFIWFRAKSEWH